MSFYYYVINYIHILLIIMATVYKITNAKKIIMLHTDNNR